MVMASPVNDPVPATITVPTFAEVMGVVTALGEGVLKD
jgi:hypothetical protein